MIKAAFFDIDGTLVSLKTKVYPPSTPNVLRRLREQGVLCFIATGRSRFEMASEHLLEGLEFDGYLTNNGQDAYDAAWRLLFATPMPHDEVAALLARSNELGLGCWLIGSECSRLNCYTPAVLAAMEAIHTRPPQLAPAGTVLAQPVYKIVLFASPAEVASLLPLAPHCRVTQWFESGFDVIASTGGKATAMLTLLARYGLTASDCIAFGDSENDIEMLQAAGIGVALGNATEDAKAAADYVTDDCDNDGLLHALEHFLVL